MVSRSLLWLVAAGGLSISVTGQDAPRLTPIPGDPLEMVNGPILAVDTPARRVAVFQLLDRARNNYALRTAGHAYDLKVTFKVDSGGQTEYDGAWKMHDVFDPQQGLRWTAKGAGGYAITRISAHGMLFGQDSAAYVPLRLQEARAALFDPIPNAGTIARTVIRTSTATLNGEKLKCVLFSASGNAATTATGRSWDESEECVDAQSGLLVTHSQVPGRYYSYDYTNAPQLAGHLLPRKVTVTEAGKTVTEISVVSLTELPAADPALFIPTEEMKAKGRAIALTEAQKLLRVAGGGPLPPGSTARAVIVFGLVTPAGQLVEAHSLQPTDPDSQAALEAAKQIDFTRQAPFGVHPQQHFVFVVEKFVTSQ